MLLDKLAEYHRRRESLPFAYKEVPVPWIVHLTAEGRLVPPVQRTSGDTRSGRNPGKSIPAPALLIQPTSGAKANLLVHRADYVLGFPGWDPGLKAIADTQRNHALFRALLRECYQATEEPVIQAVLTFLEGPENSPDAYPPDLEPRDLVGFMVDGVAPQELPSVQRFWGDYQAEATTGQSDAHCLVCGPPR
ncbi:MAG TPA: type I-C CRISPR-associated protein Cas8c/Csd1, partial [Dehalococcoidia bacterium]|nr:type I-C CRISPR-associated protein Cas8c/Csd1 [Dehalococcoidia bacterium]